MKLTNSQAARMLSALRIIDGDQSVKLSGQVRLDIARNINRLMPDVLAFEQARNGKQREMKLGTDAAALEANHPIIVDIEALGESVVDVKLLSLDHTLFNLDDNKRITGDMLAALGPILKDFDTLEGS